LRVRRPAEADDRGRDGLLPRLALPPPPAPAAGRSRARRRGVDVVRERRALSAGAVAPADQGRLELYLRWLKRYEWRDGEEEPIALILCAGKCRRARRAARTRSQRHSRGRV